MCILDLLTGDFKQNQEVKVDLANQVRLRSSACVPRPTRVPSPP